MVLISDVDQNGNNIPNKENNPPTAAATLPSNQIINDQNQKRIPTKRTRQLKLFGARNNDELSDQCKNEIDGKLMKMITTDYQPLSIVENEGFREYSKKLNGAYNLPNRKLLTETMIPNLYEESVLKLKKMLDFVSDVAVTTDIWTSDSNRAYISVTIHFIYENKMCSYNVATREIFGSHTGENIGKVLSAILNEWNIFDKVVTIVSDNGANIKNAINEHLRKHHHPCVAHTLNLSVTDAIVSNQDLSAILKKCRSLVGHFKHSVLASEKLKNTQTQMNLPVLKVKQDVATRWNSCLIMIERLLQIKDSLAVVITSLPKAPENLDASEWFILKDCVAILKPAEVITTILSGEQYPTLSLVIPLIRGLQHSLQNLAIQTECGHMLKTSLADVVTRRLGCLERNKTVAKASFLDPRFKKVGFGLEENANNTQKWISDELSILINSNKNLIDATIVQPSSESPDTLDQSLLSDKPIG